MKTTDDFFEAKKPTYPWSATEKQAQQEQKKAEPARKARDWGKAAKHYKKAAVLFRKALDLVPSMYQETTQKRLRKKETLCIKLGEGAAKLAADPKLAAQLARKHR